VHPPRGHLHHEQDVVRHQAALRPDLHCREVDRAQHVPVGLQKRLPGRLSVLRTRDHGKEKKSTQRASKRAQVRVSIGRPSPTDFERAGIGITAKENPVWGGCVEFDPSGCQWKRNSSPDNTLPISLLFGALFAT
jgi:hypothetical protein